MKQIQSKLRVLALAAGSLAITMAGANAQNTHYAAGDLVLYFQQEGNAKTVYVDLGNTATVFRGAATGPDVANILNIIDISTQLNSAFGASWATATNLYMGVAGVWGTNSTNNVLMNGDPNRTIYVGQSRDAVGTVGTANSAGYTVEGNTAKTDGSTAIVTMNAPFADATGANGFNAAAVVSLSSSTSNIATANPFLSPGIQDTAFSIFPGGVQQVGGTITSGSSYGPVSNVSFAVDLYRIQAKSGITGQVGTALDNGVGSYEGTLTLDNTGKVSFVNAVPEPSTYALFGGAALVIGFVIARRRKMAEKNS